MATPAPEITELDPATLLVDRNIREARLDKGFTDSVRERGVLQPVIAVRTADGGIRVRMGARRTLAAVQAGLATISVIIIGDEATDDAAQIERILDQFTENTRREGLTTADEARVVEQLVLLGVPAGDIQKKTGLSKTDVTAASAVAASPAAVKAAETIPSITLHQAAAIAEFDEYPAIAGRLTKAAREGGFDHELEQLRGEIASDEARDTLRKELEAAGVTVIDQPLSHLQRLDELAGPDGKPLTAKVHKNCPGHAAYLSQSYYKIGHPWEAVYYCTDPKAHKHRKLNRANPGVSQEDQSAERKQVIAGNKAWKSAETVRRRFLRELLARKTAPDGALRFIIESLARADGPLQHNLFADGMNRELLHLPRAASEHGPGGWVRTSAADVVTAVAQANDARALVIALGLILGAYEASTDIHVWRSPASYPEIGRYFGQLAAWEYLLSDIERTITDAKPRVRG